MSDDTWLIHSMSTWSSFIGLVAYKCLVVCNQKIFFDLDYGILGSALFFCFKQMSA